MEPLSITAMKNANLATIDRDELVDIRDGCTWRTAAREQIPRGCLSARSGIPTAIGTVNMSSRSGSLTQRCLWKNALRDISCRSADILDKTGRNV